jgi:periplasmic protein TonB
MQALTQTRGPFLPAFGAAAVVSLALFWLMYAVISVTGHGVDKKETLQTIDFVRLKRDTQVETLARRKPPPPPPEQPPPPQKMHIATEAATQTAAPVPMEMPSLGLSANISGGPFVGGMGGGVAAPMNSGLFDGDIIPLQRIAPQYPREAARAGITGFVELEVLVNADGTVRSAKVLNAKPKGLFDAAAVAAVMRWKFKPKVVNGAPVAQRGAQTIEFNLRSAA